MGNAFVAVADDPSAISFNPAGIAGLKGTNIYGGVTAVTISTGYESPSGQSERTDFQIFFPPHLYATREIGRDVVMGVGLYSPYGIGGKKWDEMGPIRYNSTESAIATFAINPTAAWQLTPAISVGCGVSYVMAKNRAEKMIDQSMMGAGDGKAVIKEEGQGFGYDGGVLLKAGKHLNIGAIYRSGPRVKMDGDVSVSGISPTLQPLFGGSAYKTGASTTVRFPDFWGLGLSYTPTDRITIAFEADRVRWSSFDKMELDIDEEVPAAGFTDSTKKLDWKDVWWLETGIDYRVGDHLSLRTGYSYVESHVPNSTLGPDNPHSDSHNLTIGTGYKQDRLTLDISYMIGLYKDRKVDNSILSGEYKSTAQYLGVSAGYRFD